MREYESKIETHTYLIKIVCDKCGKSMSKLEEKDIFECQEVVNIRFSCGYGSVFGDGDTYECDLCQHCVKELLGEYLKLKEPQ